MCPNSDQREYFDCGDRVEIIIGLRVSLPL